MASCRKKQDEKHLKILRNLVSLPGNKQCFDCNQRGPTYVNVTIGSFVCTTCSGLLRGLTPPHRVKSISMTTFTPEEIESLQSKGNEYCRKVWLAHYDSSNNQNTKDENHGRDFMVAKYEKKLYYMEPSASLKNGNNSFSGPSMTGTGVENFKVQQSVPNSSPVILPSINSKNFQGQANSFAPSVTSINSSDPFKAVPNHTMRQKNQVQDQQLQSQQNQEFSFANFDNNPIFNSSNIIPSNSFSSVKPNNTTVEDKYAALKDLDCLMKMQQGSPQQDQANHGNGWSSSNIEKGSNPFQTDIGINNNVINPFRSGLVQQMEKNINNNGGCGNGNYGGGYSNGGNGNNNVSFSNPNNPWGTNNAWINNGLPGSQSSPFLVPNWSEKGNFNVIPRSSNNPFL